MDSNCYIEKEKVDRVIEYEESINKIKEGIQSKNDDIEKEFLSKINSKLKDYTKLIQSMRDIIDENREKKYCFVDTDAEKRLCNISYKVTSKAKSIAKDLRTLGIKIKMD